MLKQAIFNKERLFVVGIFLLLVIGYKLAFKKTIEAWQTNKALKDQQTMSSNLSYQPNYIRRKNANLDSLIGRYKVDTINFWNSNISTISLIAEKQHVALSEVPVQDPSFNTENVIIQRLTFEGDFFSITKTLNDLQKADKVGFVRSVTYRLDKREEEKLLADVYLEILK